MSNGSARIHLREPGLPTIAVQHLAPTDPSAHADVLYVHGATFGADLSMFFAFEGQSWGDSLAAAGYRVWGLDFVGYGASDRYPDLPDPAPGDMNAALGDLERVVQEVRRHNGGQPLVLIAHSRGGAVAARYAAEHQEHVRGLVLFAPIVQRLGGQARASDSAPAAPSHYYLSAWAQYRRFIEEVPSGEAQVLSEAFMQAWASAYLASDPASGQRDPPSVRTPFGPIADIQALWRGEALYEAGRIIAPTLLIRGQWDSRCTDADAAFLLGRLGSTDKRDIKIVRATHLLHLEEQRWQLHAQVLHVLREWRDMERRRTNGLPL